MLCAGTMIVAGLEPQKHTSEVANSGNEKYTPVSTTFYTYML